MPSSHRIAISFLFAAAGAAAQVVPAPQQLGREPGSCRAGHLVRADPAFRAQADAFAHALRRLGVAAAAVADAADPAAVVELARDESLAEGAYAIRCTADLVTARASGPKGAAWAAATLLQLAEVEGGAVRWPRVRVTDRPDLPYRSFMVDMGRNPHSPATLRQVVDMCWFYKVNLLHLHLTDDQLFSWPSEAFPALQSARAGWTLGDFVELERYAVARGVAIVPELEVPGHSTILRREYPDRFGTTPTELATRPECQRAVEVLIAEMAAVFRSTPYFHIGGDEAYGVPQDVQRDFINRLDAFVKSTGKRTVVWEGPRLGTGDNKVDTGVLQINWRTIEFPAQEMLAAGYEVVCAPWDPFYVVDHYPKTMFTAVDLERCYGWDLRRFGHVDPGMPTFRAPHRTTTADGILGFCMPWWEGREENLFALCLPRLAAVASAAWNRAGENDFAGFLARQQRAIPRLEQIAGIALPELPFSDPDGQRDNLAFRARVVPSAGGAQPHFSPARLTNGITDRFDHFLGFPTQPDPLEIVIELARPAEVGRIVVHETAVGKSYEVYEVLVSAGGADYERVGEAGEGSRGEADHVTHEFTQRRVSHIKIRTRGCHGLTFPSFSRLTEVMAFRR